MFTLNFKGVTFHMKKNPSITITVIIVAVLILALVLLLPVQSNEDNQERFQKEYIAISMKAIQIDPDEVTVKELNSNDEWEDITDSFYVKYITDIQENKTSEAKKLLSDQERYSIDFNSHSGKIMPLLSEFSDGYQNRVGIFYQEIRIAKEQNLKPIKLTDEEKSIDSFCHIAFNSNYKDRFTKYSSNELKYYNTFKDVATKECIMDLMKKNTLYELDKMLNEKNERLVYKKVKIYTSGNGIVTCYRVNGKEISTVTIQLSVKFTKQGNKVLLNNISIDNILGI